LVPMIKDWKNKTEKKKKNTSYSLRKKVPTASLL